MSIGSVFKPLPEDEPYYSPGESALTGEDSYWVMPILIRLRKALPDWSIFFLDGEGRTCSISFEFYPVRERFSNFSPLYMLYLFGGEAHGMLATTMGLSMEHKSIGDIRANPELIDKLIETVELVLIEHMLYNF